MSSSPSRQGLFRAVLLGSLLQLVLVIAGHSRTSVAVLFPFMGTGIGGVTGLLTAIGGAPGLRSAARLGALAGGATGLIGTVVSFALGDIPAFTIGVGTGAAAMAGGFGALGGRLLGNRRGV